MSNVTRRLVLNLTVTFFGCMSRCLQRQPRYAKMLRFSKQRQHLVSRISHIIEVGHSRILLVKTLSSRVVFLWEVRQPELLGEKGDRVGSVLAMLLMSQESMSFLICNIQLFLIKFNESVSVVKECFLFYFTVFYVISRRYI